MSGLLCFVVFLGVVCGVLVPHTPCKEIFGYYISQTSEVFAAIGLDNDLSGNYDLEVNMSIPLETTENIKISKRTSDEKIKNGESFEFYVHFPYDHSFPKLTSITWNGKTVCTGPPETGPTVTPLSKRYLFKTEILPSVLRLQTTSAPIENTQLQINININNNNNNNDNQECGINIDYKSLVFSGRSTKIGEYPWLVAMFYLKQRNYGYRCGASIISNKHVITAAHCMKDQYNINLDKEDILLVMGKLNIKHWAVRSTIRGVKEFIIHPDYKHPADADLAVIILDRPVTFSVKIKPICLWDESTELQNIVGLNGNVAGWGRDETGREYVNKLQKISMPVTSHEMCLWADERFLKLTSNRTFCAGDRSGHAPCTGDSGSGFIIKRNGKWYLRGVVSVALADPETKTCDINNYAVFSDVSKFDNWLRRAMQIS